MLQLSMDVLFVIWSTTFGRLVSGSDEVGTLLVPIFLHLSFSFRCKSFYLFLSTHIRRDSGVREKPIWVVRSSRESEWSATQLPFQLREKKQPKNSCCSLYPTRQETNWTNSHNLIKLYEF